MRPSSRSLLTQLAWHSLAVLILLCLPVLRFRELWWELPQQQLAPMVVLIAAYGASALAVMLLVRADGPRPALRAASITLVVFSLSFALLLFAPIIAPRYLLAPIFLAALVLIPLHAFAVRLRLVGVIALAVALVLAAGLAAYRLDVTREVEAGPATAYLKTTLYDIRLIERRDVIPARATPGGGMDHLGDDVLLGTGDGLLYALDVAHDGRVQARELPARAPLDRTEFAAASNRERAPRQTLDDSHDRGPPRRIPRLLLTDVLTQTDGDALRIFASHHYWKPDEKCFVVRVSMIDASLGSLDESLREEQWRTLYDSEPCLALTADQPGEPVDGRLALLDGETLLLALGDSSLAGEPSFSQDPQAAYGKTIRIDVVSGDSDVYTLGHGDPQGLYVAGDGRVWLTERRAGDHARNDVRDGDEVNLLMEQGNYGWPLVSYGANAGEILQPQGARQGRHEGFTAPAFAWAPGIGVSGVAGVERDLFAAWRGDLIAGSLAMQSLYRLVIEGERIVLAEPIPIGRRVRDVLELNDGRLLLWTDAAALVTLEPLPTTPPPSAPPQGVPGRETGKT